MLLALGELLLSCNWAVVADILLVGVGLGLCCPLAWKLGGASETMGRGTEVIGQFPWTGPS